MQKNSSSARTFTFLKAQHGRWGYDEKDPLIFDDQEAADLFNQYFQAVVTHEEELIAINDQQVALINQRAQAKRSAR